MIGPRQIQSGPLRGTEQYVVAVEGISVLRDLDTLPEDVKRAAVRAVNYATRRARTRGADLMRKEVNFPARYLSGSDGRLSIGKPATEQNMESRITGRFAPTSLARFAVGSKVPNKAGVRVEVAPGFAKLMKRAFLIRLPQGKTLDVAGGVFNLGLAIRLKAGETIENKHKIVQMNNGLTLLYGPSVDQVFSTVSVDMLPEVEGWLNQEFARLMDQRQKGNVF